MPQTPRLAVPLIAAGQSQKDVTHNDAVLALERLVALAVVSRSAATPPASPALGDVQIVPATGTAAWGQPAGTLMHWQGGGWLPVPPQNGQMALVLDEGLMLVHRAGWQALWPVAGLMIAGRNVLAAAPANVGPPSGGGNIDVQARAAVAAVITALQQQGILAA
jgi:hypothetical protein